MADTSTTLRGISEIRAFFRTNQTPIYFVSPTAFNLLGIDRWVRNFFYVNYFDSFEGTPPARVRAAGARRTASSSRWRTSATTCCATRRSLDFIGGRGPGGKAVFVMFDEETEALAAQGGPRGRAPVGRAAPPPGLEDRHHPAGRTRPACRACPTRSAARRRYDELLALADAAGLGDDLVVQTPYGDSGKTTFFIRGSADWDRYAARPRRPRSSR